MYVTSSNEHITDVSLYSIIVFGCEEYKAKSQMLSDKHRNAVGHPLDESR